jgi:phosphate-selective porin O/P
MLYGNLFRQWFIGVILTVGCVSITHADAPDAEEMWKIIQQQQKIIEQLQLKLEQTDQKIEVASKKVEETAEEVEVAVEAIEISQQSSAPSWADKTSISGYGELHYNNLSDENNTVGGDDGLNRVDFHRFVLEVGHEFNDSIRFYSELELEHTLVADNGTTPGTIELEQGWIEIDVNQNHRFRAGLDTLPIGIINPTHEPNTFYGVERNRVESEIIPTTWREAGAALKGEVAPGWNYDIVVHSGLVSPITGSSTLRPRSGRTQIANADNQDIAYTGRLRFTGMPGLEVGLSGQYQSDMSGTADAFDVNATLFEGHVDYKHNSGLALRALYARWDIDAPAGIVFNQDNIDGWYIEPAYRFKSPGLLPGEIGIFTRYAEWDERGQGNVPNGTYARFESWNVGMNWWPHQNVAFKFDYQNESGDSRVDALRDGFNLGVGYQF